MGSPAWHGFDVYKVSLVERKALRLTTKSSYGLCSPSISWEKNLLLYSGSDAYPDNVILSAIGEPNNVSVFHADGADYWLLEKGKKQRKVLRDPCLSPDGSLVVCAVSNTNDDYRWIGHDIHVIEVATEHGRKVTGLNRLVRGPRFSCDGTKMLFASAPLRSGDCAFYDLWVMHVDSCSIHRIPIR